jgi:hypothetical protein
MLIFGFVQLSTVRLQSVLSSIDCRGQPVPDPLERFAFNRVEIEKAGKEPFGVLGGVEQFLQGQAMTLRRGGFLFWKGICWLRYFWHF